ncbi:MAG TPA: hypothetical protein VNU48_11040 [Burkholderiaceae bacterium]|nr:hypothetical protein [Burkholderiaceae bacterium]
MSTRFYAGPISIGMGRRWDDKFEPERGAESKPRPVRPPFGRMTASMVPPSAPSSTDSLAPRTDPIAPQR